MTITYEFELTALCPNEPHPRNFYHARIESSELIWAEDIQATVEELADAIASQEALTVTLSARFPETTVTLIGRHGGVLITSRETSH